YAVAEVVVAEQAQIDDRMVLGGLPGEEQREAQRGDDREAEDEARAEPVELAALVEHELQAADAKHEQRHADAVNRQLAGRRFAVLEQMPGEERREYPYRDIDQEDP